MVKFFRHDRVELMHFLLLTKLLQSFSICLQLSFPCPNVKIRCLVSEIGGHKDDKQVRKYRISTPPPPGPGEGRRSTKARIYDEKSQLPDFSATSHRIAASRDALECCAIELI